MFVYNFLSVRMIFVYNFLSVRTTLTPVYDLGCDWVKQREKKNSVKPACDSLKCWCWVRYTYVCDGKVKNTLGNMLNVKRRWPINKTSRIWLCKINKTKAVFSILYWMFPITVVWMVYKLCKTPHRDNHLQTLVCYCITE